MFAVRITRDFQSLKSFFDRVVLHPQSVCVVFQHDADEEVSRTHVHAMISMNVGSSDTLKRWIKQVVGHVDRYDWAFPLCKDEDRYVTYMSKGKLEPLVCHGIEYEKVIALRSEWKEIPAKAVPSGDKRGDITSYSMAEELANYINDNMLRKKEIKDKSIRGMIMTRIVHDAITQREIIEECIKIHRKYRKGFCDFSLVRVIQTAYGICDDETWKNNLCAKVEEKLSLRIV